MAGKVIDLNPTKRLSKEAFDLMKKMITEMDYEEASSLIVIFTPQSGGTSVQAYGLDFQALGFASAVLTTLSQELLAEEILQTLE